jgi:hypothetical protein
MVVSVITSARLQIARTQPRVLGDPCEHLRANLFAIVEGEDEVGPPVPRQGPMRTGLTLQLPPNGEKGGENAPRLGRGPLAHAAATEILMDCARVSPCSKRSAMTQIQERMVATGSKAQAAFDDLELSFGQTTDRKRLFTPPELPRRFTIGASQRPPERSP